jgi:predicted nucleotidyltransferase
MCDIIPTDWAGFLKEIKKTIEDLGFEKNQEIFFRGHTNKDYKLIPSLLRGATLDESHHISKELFKIEADLFYEFRSRAKGIHGAGLNDWDVLFYMQHHRLRTRLLDWTETFGVALYFALGIGMPCRKYETYSPCIWIMNPYELNYESTDSYDLYDPELLEELDADGEKLYDIESYSTMLLGNHKKCEGKMMNWKQPVALYPIRKGDRLTNQGGYFTIHGNDLRPIEEQNKLAKYVQKICIPEAAIKEAEEFLKDAGINEFTLFPDLDGLAKYLNIKYFE